MFKLSNNNRESLTELDMKFPKFREEAIPNIEEHNVVAWVDSRTLTQLSTSYDDLTKKDEYSDITVSQYLRLMNQHNQRTNFYRKRKPKESVNQQSPADALSRM
jgi:hypothetical protein